jgi:hypothetical protein
MIDGMDQKAEYDKTKTRYEQQNKAFEALRKSGSDDDSFPHKHRMGNKKDRNDPRRKNFGGNRRGKSGPGGGGPGGSGVGGAGGGD